jgi:hypothetical protein
MYFAEVGYFDQVIPAGVDEHPIKIVRKLVRSRYHLHDGTGTGPGKCSRDCRIRYIGDGNRIGIG